MSEEGVKLRLKSRLERIFGITLNDIREMNRGQWNNPETIRWKATATNHQIYQSRFSMHSCANSEVIGVMETGGPNKEINVIAM